MRTVICDMKNKTTYNLKTFAPFKSLKYDFFSQ